MNKRADPDYHKKYYIEHAEARRLQTRRWSLKAKFGITEEQYDELFQRQNGCCLVCTRHQEHFKNRLAVDHNHKTGEIRGLLCTFCNRFFIGRHSDPDAFDRAAAYLRQGTGWFVPEKKKRRTRRKRK